MSITIAAASLILNEVPMFINSSSVSSVNVSNASVGGTAQITATASQGSSTNLLLSGFNPGSNATIDGLSANDFTLRFADTIGTYGYGLQIQAVSDTGGNAVATVTLPGYSTADLMSGRLTAGFQTDPLTQQPSLLIHAA